ncbi:hypothetical protein ACQCTC_25975, partial [Ralstonia pseudosolanacearum]
MRPTLVMRSLAGVAVIAIAALSYWIGVQRLHASRAEAAVPHSGQQAVAQSGLPDGKGAADARAGWTWRESGSGGCGRSSSGCTGSRR